MKDAKTKQGNEPAPDPTTEAPHSLGAVAIASDAFAKTAADVPAARRREEEESEEAPVIDAEPRAPRVALRFKVIVGLAVFGCVGILAMAAVRSNATGAALPATAALTAPVPVEPVPTAAGAPAAAPPPSIAAVSSPWALANVRSTSTPTPLAAAEPAAPSNGASEREQASPNRATIRLASGKQPLTVDGKRANGPSVVVACGSHMVVVGAEKPKRIEAPCGRTILVGAAKSTAAKSENAKHDGKALATPPKKH